MITHVSIQNFIFNVGFVEFDSEELCLIAFAELTKINENSENLHNSNSLANDEISYTNYNWKQAKSYTVKDIIVNIEIRVSEVGDIERKSAKTDAVFYKFYAREDIKTRVHESKPYNKYSDFEKSYSRNYKNSNYERNYEREKGKYYSNRDYRDNKYKNNNKSRDYNKNTEKQRNKHTEDNKDNNSKKSRSNVNSKSKSKSKSNSVIRDRMRSRSRS